MRLRSGSELSEEGEEKTSEVVWIIKAGGSGGVYGRVTEARLVFDGGTYELPVASYDSVKRTSGSAKKRVRRDDETIVLRLDSGVLGAIVAGADSSPRGSGLEGRGASLLLGKVRLGLRGRPMQALRVFDAKLRSP